MSLKIKTLLCTVNGSKQKSSLERKKNKKLKIENCGWLFSVLLARIGGSAVTLVDNLIDSIPKVHTVIDVSQLLRPRTVLVCNLNTNLRENN